MSIDEARRRELWSSLRETLGETHADTLMTMLPDQPLPAIATRDDMTALTITLRSEIRAEGNAVRADLRKDFGELRAEFGRIEGGLRGELGEFEGRLRGELGEFEGRLRGELGELRADLARQTLTLGLALGSLIVAVLGTVLTLGFTGAFS